MGQVMGADFSGVKVHTDTQSDQLNQSIQARAFTTKQDIFFRKGAYDPSSPGGQELIAHELTHVMQQNGSDVSLQRIISAPCGVVQRDYYAWGNAGETPHLHVYNDGFHLKISDRGGIQRYNIVKKNQIHAQSADALAAVEGKHFRKLRRRIKRVAKDEFGFDL
jgi:hypothetical protein